MQADFRASTLGILTKFWRPGRVKTRLGASIGMHRAAALHRLFVIHLCEQLAMSGDHRIVCLDPPEQAGAFHEALNSIGLGANWQVTEQGAGSLGSRMRRWFERELADSDAAAILIGGDCPTLAAAEIDMAVALLQEHQAVLGPATDGGYVLIGLRGPWRYGSQGHRSLFDEIPWSTEGVLEITCQRLRQASLSAAEMPAMSDIDTESDLDHLCHRLESDDPEGLGAKIELILAAPESDEVSA